MRVDNWPSVLMKMVEKAEHEPFEWGVNDCCLWTANIVKALTGHDYASLMRDLYSNEKEAKEIYEGLTLQEYVSTILGSSTYVNYAQRGDVVLKSFPVHGQTLGICIGDRVAFKTLTGLVFWPTLKCDCTWRIK